MKIEILETVDSTNSWMKRKIPALSEPFCVVAREQTLGRGRYQNNWISPRDSNLYFTYAEPRRFSLITYLQASALALQKVISSYGITSQIKWPNDLLVDGKKMAGILIEGTEKENEPWAVIGIGLNVNMDENLLASIGRPATSLRACFGKNVSLEKIRENVLSELLNTLTAAQNDLSGYEKVWKEACSWIVGQQTTIRTSRENISGHIEDIHPSGELILRCKDGSHIRISQGEIV